MFRQSLENTLYPFFWSGADDDRLFVDRPFPTRFQQSVQRVNHYAIMCTPIVSDGCPCYLEQPFLHTQGAALSINTAYRLNKYLRRQVLSLFAVAHLAIDIAVNEAQIFLIERLKLLHIHPGTSRRSSIYVCLFTFQRTHNALSARTARYPRAQ